MIPLSVLLCAAVLVTSFIIRRPRPKLLAGWHWVEIDYIGLAVPDTFQLSKLQGVEGEYSQLSDGHTRIEVDLDGGGIWYDLSDPSFSERHISIDGYEAKLVFHKGIEQDQPWVPTSRSIRYFVGAEMTSPGLFKSGKIAVSASCPSPEERETATSILQSIRVEKYTWSYFRFGP